MGVGCWGRVLGVGQANSGFYINCIDQEAICIGYERPSTPYINTTPSLGKLAIELC